jgi:hypothetical protein
MNQKKMQRSQSIICNKLLVSNHNHGEKSISLETQNDKLLHKLVNTNETDSAGNESLNANNSTEQLNVNTQTDTGLLYDTSLNFMNTFLIRIFSVEYYFILFYCEKLNHFIQLYHFIQLGFFHGK